MTRTAAALSALFLLGVAGQAQAQFESCHFEEVDFNVSIIEGFGWDDFFLLDTPYEDAIEELEEELDEKLGDSPTPGYYQVRYFVRSGWFLALVPVTLCLEIEEGESVEDAVNPDDDSDDSNTGNDSDSGDSDHDGDSDYDEESDDWDDDEGEEDKEFCGRTKVGEDFESEVQCED